MTGSHEVRGSIPLGSTNPINNLVDETLSLPCLLAPEYGASYPDAQDDINFL